MHEEYRGDDYSCDGMNNSGESFPCKRSGQTLNSWDKLMFHIKMQTQTQIMDASKVPAPAHISVITSLKNKNVTSVDSDLQMKIVWRTTLSKATNLHVNS